MRCDKVWIEQCRAEKAIKRRFGAKNALDYLIGEKLMMFADAPKDDSAFAKKLPKFLAALQDAVLRHDTDRQGSAGKTGTPTGTVATGAK